MFGQSKPGGFSTGTFGQTGAFGSTTPFGGGTATFGTPGGFGNQAPASGGLFGNTSTQNTSGIFGGASSTGFGQTQNTSFGGFGTQTSQASGGIFGQTQPQTSNIFGTPQPSSAFGTKTPAPAAFGATQSSGGLFGATTGSSALFGGTTTTQSGGLFGSGGAFGASSAQTAGTTIKFNPLSGTDTVLKSGVSQSISTRHQCITAMKEYENKSLEELRMEDYAANRKGPQAGGATAGGLFGAQNTQQSAGFGFGSQQQQQAKPAGFGFANNNNASTGLFNQQQGGGGLFGSTANKSLFGTTTTTATATGTGFGFGQTNTSQAGSLFGANQQKPLFGTATTQSSGGLFGQTQTSSAFGTSGGSSFGTFGTNTQAQSGGGLFGAAKPAFGVATSTAGGLGFGQQTTGGLFGNKPATGTGFNFGQTANTGFGATQAGGLFGAAKPGGFGLTTGGLGSTGGFSTGLGAGTSLFNTGQQNKLAQGSTFGATTGLGGLGTSSLGAGLSLAGSTNTGLGVGSDAAASLAQAAQIQQQLLVLSNSPYGESPLFKNLKSDESKREDALKPTNPAAQKAALTAANQYKVNPRPTAKIKPKPLQLLNNKSQLFDGLDEEESTFGNDTFVPRKSIKKLVIKNLRSPNSSVLNGSHNKSQLDPDSSTLVAPSPIMPPTKDTDQRNGEPDTSPNPTVNGDTNIIRGRKALNTSVNNTPIRNKYGGMGLDDTITALNSHNRSATDNNSSQLSSAGEDEDEDDDRQEMLPHPAGIKLSRPGYYTLPPLGELASLVDKSGGCWVEDLVVGREGYGNVFFPGLTNIAGLNLDTTVHFRRKEITVYPDDDKKPSVGSGLNKKAQVTLDCVWPNDKSNHIPIKSPQRLSLMNYQEKIEQATNKIGAKFVDYRPETGSWVFEVRHFSKYGLLDDSDDEAEPPEKDPKKLKLLQQKTQQQLAIQKKKMNQEMDMDEGSVLEPQSLVKGGAPALVSPLVPISGKVPPLRPGTATAYKTAAVEEEEEEEEGEEEDDDDDSNMEDLMREEMPSTTDFLAMSRETVPISQEDHTPASHRLAAHLGVSSQTVQVMKASFFDDEDEMDTDSCMEPARRGLGGPLLRGPHRSAPTVDKPLDLLGKRPALASSSPSLASSSPTPVTTLPRSFMYDRLQSQQPVRPTLKPFHQKVPDHIILPSGLEGGADKPRKLVGSRIMRAVPSLTDSVTANKDHMLMDMALFKGRLCRASWGPGFTLVHCGNPINHTPLDPPDKPSILPRLVGSHRRRLDESPFEVVVEKINITGYSTEADPALKNMLEKTLEIQLKHCEMSLESGFPVFVPSPGVSSLHRCAEQACEDEERIANHPYAPTVHHTRMVWDLCVALWGKLHQFIDSEPDSASHDLHMARREAFSRWLSATAVRKIKQEVNQAKVKGLSHLPGVCSYMTARMISEACALSQESGDHRLAMLLAQSAGTHISRQLLSRQLSKWEELKADNFVDVDRLRLYALLAGTMVWSSNQGEINVCESLDWKRCLAVHLWYFCTPTATIAESLNVFEKAFSGMTSQGRYSSLPLPPYLEDTVDKLYDEDGEGKEMGDGEGRYAIRDMCYHLLKLYSDRSHRLERILTPTTSTPNHLDFTLSWHLMQVLQSLQYTHLSTYAQASVTAGFAAQLEALGLWHWAVFVLLHIQDPTSREHTVRALLGRHMLLSRDADYVDREHFIQERLEVPPMWIHEAKAQRARTEGRSAEEAWHLVKAGRWNLAHRIVLRHVAADAIINERYGYLKRYLREMAPPEYSSSIQDWATGGKVFLDYITMIETLDEIKQGDMNSYELERLQPEVTSLCSRIEHVTCYTAKDRLCQSEMAKRTANLLRMLLLLQQSRTEPHKTHLSSRLVAPHITKLPLPEDYALQELRQLTRAHMIEMTS